LSEQGRNAAMRLFLPTLRFTFGRPSPLSVGRKSRLSGAALSPFAIERLARYVDLHRKLPFWELDYTVSAIDTDNSSTKKEHLLKISIKSVKRTNRIVQGDYSTTTFVCIHLFNIFLFIFI
jgi:hypothetical protein